MTEQKMTKVEWNFQKVSATTKPFKVRITQRRIVVELQLF